MTDGRKTNYHHVDATVRYAKVFYENRDMGRPGTDVDYTATDGQYQIEVLVDDTQKAEMIEQGIPEISMGYQQFKKDSDSGLWSYRLKRPHLSKNLKEDDGSRVVMGAPIVFDYNKAVEVMKEKGGKLADHITPWDMTNDGLIGNGSKAYVTYTVYKNGKKRIIDLQKIGIYDHVKYEGNNTPTDGQMVMF